MSREYHGLSYHPLYKVWHGLNDRCNNPKYYRYKDYGGRGIKVCVEWRDSLIDFVEWSMKNGYREGLQLDREDNDGDYSPDNCRYVLPSVNQLNQRRRSDNSSGFRGVYYKKRDSNWFWEVGNIGDRTSKHGYNSAQEASDARDLFIISNGLGHPLNKATKGDINENN